MFFFSLKMFLIKSSPWQYCGTSSLELRTDTPLAITGMRGAVGGRHSAAAKRPVYYISIRRFPLRDVGNVKSRKRPKAKRDSQVTHVKLFLAANVSHRLAYITKERARVVSRS